MSQPASDDVNGAGLLDRHVSFVGALRAAGLPVSMAESLDAGRAVTAIEMTNREQLRHAYAAAVVKHAAHRPAFDRLFDLWWPPALGDGSAGDYADGDGEGDPLDEIDPADLDAMRNMLRDRLRDVLLSGDDEALRRLAREAVNGLGRADGQPGRQSWFTYRVLRALNPETLMASLLEAVLQGQDRGGLAEKVARQMLTERIKQFEEMVESEVRRRLAEDRGAEAIAKTAVKPLIEQVEFLRASRDDLAQLRRQVYPLARRLATRLTAKRRLGRRGRLDVRRTVRASLSSGGVPLTTIFRPHKPHKPELVVLCDVSGSVAAFAHFTVLLAFALREQFAKVRVFAFVDTTDEVTDFFSRGGDVVDALARMSSEADVVWYDGHSDYGHAFEVFAQKWPDAVTPKTSLLVLGDARTNYRAPAIPALRSMVRQARHAFWLNPEPRQYWSSGDSAASTYGEVMPMIECRNVLQLQEFVEGLLPA
ncbi:MAG TPA: VWA domain-containing protein [Mycobacteriales bacterium]|nr:VWA domain-containing protein [Mycobacteriales bacterium]